MRMQSMVSACTAGLLAGTFVVATALVAAVPATAAESTWEMIQRTGVLRSGVLDAAPYFWREGVGPGAEWRGAMVEMSKDIAKALNVKLEIVDVGGFCESILALTAGRVDMQFSLQATPARAKAIDFAGPAYYMAFSNVNSATFKGRTWADYNKPEVKVAVEIGSSNETILRKMAPRATVVGLRTRAEAIMAVKYGRADAFNMNVMSGLLMKKVNPELGEVVVPTPVAQLPGYIGIRQEPGDTRLRSFLNWWCEWNVLLGNNERMLKEALQARGIDDIPEYVHF